MEVFKITLLKGLLLKEINYITRTKLQAEAFPLKREFH